MKKLRWIIPLFAILIAGGLAILNGMKIENPTLAGCDIIEITASRVYEGSSKDVMISAPNGDTYYINRGLEAGLTIDDVKKKILNKKVILHLPRIMYDKMTSKHIAHISTKTKVIYSEYK